jgi:hypothetical protein
MIDGFERSNSNPGAVLNSDRQALEAYKKKKMKNKEIDNLKKEVSDIKEMLCKILDKIG